MIAVKLEGSENCTGRRSRGGGECTSPGSVLTREEMHMVCGYLARGTSENAGKMVRACFIISGQCLFSLFKLLRFARFTANRVQNFMHPASSNCATKVMGVLTSSS